MLYCDSKIELIVFYCFFQEMWDQEKKHLEKFNEILAENRVRPTALLPLWNIAGFVLGRYSSKAYIRMWISWTLFEEQTSVQMVLVTVGDFLCYSLV